MRPRPSIVVLPIDDYSQGAPGDLFTTALTELVTASLAERNALVVLSRTSASRIGGRHASVPELARELGVDFVLESSVSGSANRIRVVAQLIDGRSDEHVWVGRYDRETGDILGVQSEIADQIARAIDAAVLSGSAQRASATGSHSASGRSGVKIDARARAVRVAEHLAPVQQH